jgi:hypothetical protein
MELAVALALSLGLTAAVSREASAASGEAARRGVAGGGHEVLPLLAVRARPADAVLLADGRVGGFVRQDGLEARGANRVGP